MDDDIHRLQVSVVLIGPMQYLQIPTLINVPSVRCYSKSLSEITGTIVYLAL